MTRSLTTGCIKSSKKGQHASSAEISEQDNRGKNNTQTDRGSFKGLKKVTREQVCTHSIMRASCVASLLRLLRTSSACSRWCCSRARRMASAWEQAATTAAAAAGFSRGDDQRPQRRLATGALRVSMHQVGMRQSSDQWGRVTHLLVPLLLLLLELLELGALLLAELRGGGRSRTRPSGHSRAAGRKRWAGCHSTSNPQKDLARRFPLARRAPGSGPSCHPQGPCTPARASSSAHRQSGARPLQSLRAWCAGWKKS